MGGDGRFRKGGLAVGAPAGGGLPASVGVAVRVTSAAACGLAPLLARTPLACSGDRVHGAALTAGGDNAISTTASSAPSKGRSIADLLSSWDRAPRSQASAPPSTNPSSAPRDAIPSATSTLTIGSSAAGQAFFLLQKRKQELPPQCIMDKDILKMLRESTKADADTDVLAFQNRYQDAFIDHTLSIKPRETWFYRTDFNFSYKIGFFKRLPLDQAPGSNSTDAASVGDSVVSDVCGMYPMESPESYLTFHLLEIGDEIKSQGQDADDCHSVLRRWTAAFVLTKALEKSTGGCNICVIPDLRRIKRFSLQQALSETLKKLKEGLPDDANGEKRGSAEKATGDLLALSKSENFDAEFLERFGSVDGRKKLFAVMAAYSLAVHGNTKYLGMQDIDWDGLIGKTPDVLKYPLLAR